MSIPTVSGVQTVFNLLWRAAGEDLCDILKPTLQDGGPSGDTQTTAAIASNVRCVYQSAGQNAPIVIGGKAYIASHQLQMLRTEELAVITPEYRIRIHARGDKGEMVFQEPLIVSESFDPLILLRATLVRQGHEE